MSFTEVLGTPLTSDYSTSQALAVGDLDGDLDLDVLIGNLDSMQLFRNDGGSNFIAVLGTPVTVAKSVQVIAFSDLVPPTSPMARACATSAYRALP